MPGIALSNIGWSGAGSLRHLVELSSAGVIGVIQITEAEVLCCQLNDIRHHPCVKPVVAKVSDFHGCFFFGGLFRDFEISRFRHLEISRFRHLDISTFRHFGISRSRCFVISLFRAFKTRLPFTGAAWHKDVHKFCVNAYSSSTDSCTKSSTFLRLASMRSYSSLEPTMSLSNSRRPVPAGMR